MPFYEYVAANLDESCDQCREPFEVRQSIHDYPLQFCPRCNNEIQKMISQIGGVVFLHKMANQYNDCKYAKYWRDADGNRHRVSGADGSSKSPTASSRRKRTDAEVEAIKRRDAAKSKRRRVLGN